MPTNPLKQLLDNSIQLTELSRKQLEEAVNSLVKAGAVNRSDSDATVQSLLERGRQVATPDQRCGAGRGVAPARLVGQPGRRHRGPARELRLSRESGQGSSDQGGDRRRRRRRRRPRPPSPRAKKAPAKRKAAAKKTREGFRQEGSGQEVGGEEAGTGEEGWGQEGRGVLVRRLSGRPPPARRRARAAWPGGEPNRGPRPGRGRVRARQRCRGRQAGSSRRRRRRRRRRRSTGALRRARWREARRRDRGVRDRGRRAPRPRRRRLHGWLHGLPAQPWRGPRGGPRRRSRPAASAAARRPTGHGAREDEHPHGHDARRSVERSIWPSPTCRSSP